MLTLSSIFYFIITIGILVVVHELGHYLAAISCGMRAEVFAIGMGKRLFGWNRKTKFSFGKLPEDLDLEGNTDYRVALFPIGGYVKISGMIDESLDTDFLKKEPQPWEFRSKPKWQRAVVLSAGVFMNLLLAVVIYWGIIYQNGITVRPITEIGFVAPNSTAARAGLQRGDKILSINTVSIHYWDEIESTIYTESVGRDLAFRVQRSDTVKEIQIVRSSVPDLTLERFGIDPVGDIPLIRSVFQNEPAGHAGLQPGDTITGINGVPVGTGNFSGVIGSNSGKEFLLSWSRNGQPMSARLTPNQDGKIGVGLASGYQKPFEQLQYGFFEAFPAGIRELTNQSKILLSNIYQLIAGKASLSKSVGGPVTIAQMARQTAEIGIPVFIEFIGLLSISLALLNILPFPALDGGHLLFLLIEAVIRREVPSKIKIAVQQAGFIILLVFMAFVLYNDFLKL